jgi:outer membrane protein OmpA-like peptidoglycan-associated protein|tara:strand:- start:499 stop:1362 length:864 start_codon:yes stop_codon:yes gene_type:complete
MKFIALIAFFLTSLMSLAADRTFIGTWQGVFVESGHSIESGTIVYVDFKLNDGVLTGNMREEKFETDYFAVTVLTGNQKSNVLKYKQVAVSKNKKTSKMKWCRRAGELRYNSVKGYLIGAFKSSDCKRLSGKLILYKSEFELSKSYESHASHIWFPQFVKDFKEGLSAPAIREIERDNFEFEPIFFDFDKFDIREEHSEFLDAMIKIVKGHSDLRVKVTGHTDTEGSDGYNYVLSRERSEAIIQYFVDHGLNKERLEFDFKGESNPAATNETADGRQRNRRVDFEFI